MSTAPREADGFEPSAFGAGRDAERLRIVAALEAGTPPAFAPPRGRLAELAGRFGLDSLETDVLALLWIGAVDPAVRLAMLGRSGLSPHVSALLAADLFGHPPRPRLSAGSPLLLWSMVQEHELVDGGAALTIDPVILAWLDGIHELDRALAGHASLLEPGPELESWKLDPLAARIHQGLLDGRRWRVRIASDDRIGARWFAAALGRRIGLSVLEVLPGVATAASDSPVRLHRQAFLDGCIPYFPTEAARLASPAGVLPFAIQIVQGAGSALPEDDRVVDLEIRLDPPGAEDRERLWRRLWPACATWAEGSLTDLALCHQADIADIVAVAAASPIDARAAAAGLRERLRGQASTLVRPIDAAFRWDDLVLPDATRARLDEIVFEARERALLWDEPAAARLFPYGRGLVALFAGPPGTGKTMAAQVIAADLGLDLLAVDLSAVVSKWVGETAQHLQQLLTSRASQRSILFFDEADSLYAKRIDEIRDAQDRYVNQDSSHLMTALEAYPGIVILATNLKANIDTAFLRRIRHVVDFPKADAAAREAIWRKAVTALFPARQAKSVLPRLERVARLEASGAAIKNAALSAAFACRQSGEPPTARLLGERLARELGKEGVGISRRDLDAVLGSGN